MARREVEDTTTDIRKKVFFMLSFISMLLIMLLNSFIRRNTVLSLFELLNLQFNLELASVFDFWSLSMPIIIILIVLTVIRDLRTYNIKTLEIRGPCAIVRRRKSKIILTCNEVVNMPRVIISEEQRREMNLKHLENIHKKIYQYSYLMSLNRNLSDKTCIAFEISSKNGVIKLRFYVVCEGKNTSETETIVEGSKVCSAFQSVYGEVKFRNLNDKELVEAIWSPVGGKIYEMKKEKEMLAVTNEDGRIYLTVLEISGIPEIKALSKKTQTDNLIQCLIEMKSKITIIFTLRPSRGLKQLIGKKIDEHRIRATYKELKEKSKEKTDLKAKHDAIKIEEEYLEKIEMSKKTGEWKVQAYAIVLGEEKDRVFIETQKLKTALLNIYGGQTSTVKIRVLKASEVQKNIGRIIFKLPLRGGKTTLASSFRLAAYLHLPEKPFPTSATSVETATFEIPPKSLVTGPLILGKVLYLDKEIFNIGITPKDLTMHMAVIGQTGFGKTRCIQKLLYELSKLRPDIGWVVFDWKGEYAGLIKIIDQPILVLRPLTDYAPLYVNLFDPMGADPEEHAHKLFSIIREIYSSMFEAHETQLSLQMERVLREALTKVIIDPKKRNFRGLYRELDVLQDKWQKNIPTVSATIEALKNRLDKLTKPPLGEIFTNPPNVNFDNLLDKKVIIDLSKVRLKGTRDDARLLMNILVKYFFDAALRRGLQEDLKHLIVVEEAQFLVPQLLVKKTTIEGTPIEDMIMLERATGQGLIFSAVRPIISEHILANTLVKIAFRTQTDSHIVAKYMNLNENQEKHLRILPKREAIILHPNFPYPYRIRTLEFSIPKVSVSEIRKNNIKHFSNIYTKNFKHVNQNAIEQKFTGLLDELCIPDDDPFILSTINEQHITIIHKIQSKYEFLGRVLELVREAKKRGGKEVILLMSDKNKETAERYLNGHHLPVRIFSLNEVEKLKRHVQSPTQTHIFTGLQELKVINKMSKNLDKSVSPKIDFPKDLEKIRRSPLKLLIFLKLAEYEIASVNEIAKDLKLVENVVEEICQELTRTDLWEKPPVKKVGPQTYKITKYGHELIKITNFNINNMIS